MRSSALKSLLKGLTCFCAIFSLLFAVGCAGKTPARTPAPNVQTSADAFAPEPFIMKTPASGDYDTLRRYLRSSDKTVAHSAGMILGYYYIMAEDYWNADNLFKRYYNERLLPPFMQKFGELWYMDFALAKQEFQTAERWAAKAKIGLENKERLRALEMYCLVNKLKPAGDDPYSCVTTRLESAKTDAVSAISRFQ